MKDPRDTATIEIERTRPTREQVLALMAQAAAEQSETLSDEDREWLDMPPIGAEFGASEDD